MVYIAVGGKIMDKNEEALALAYKRAKGKSLKIRDLNIESDMEEDAIRALIVYQAKAKAKADGKDDFLPFIKGQEWYIRDLIAFSALTAQERLDVEYDSVFGDVASEEEMLVSLEGLV